MLVIETENPEKLRKLREEHGGKYLIEIARRGNGNSIHYIIAESPDYEEMLWETDNEVNEDGKEFIGSSESMRL